VCPAHGAGSVCGSSISSRTWTTIGLERQHNPRLRRTDREAFIADAAVEVPKAPYFREMERRNLGAGPILGALPAPEKLSPNAFARKVGDAIVLDTRCPGCYGAAHVPGSFAIPEEEIPSYAGWFLPYDRPILLVSESPGAETAMRYLVRLGYDQVDGVLKGCMKSWHAAGKRSATVAIAGPHQFLDLLRSRRPLWVLDVRSAGELESVPPVEGAHHIHITEVPGRLDEIPRAEPIYTICATGTRAGIVASLLKRAGIDDVTAVLGGMVGLARASGADANGAG
jgi:hydroxyacylglutathione hydrolase